MSVWNFYSAGEIHFGCGVVNSIGRLARERRFAKVLVVTDRQLADAGIVDRIRRPLEAEGVSVELFEDGRAEPSLEEVIRCVDRARACSPDAILGLGGGSNMDVAKHSAAVVTHGGHPRDYFGEDNVPGPVLPLICIPTTAGTASEVTGATVLTDTDAKLKAACLSNFLRPAIAMVDPELTLSCPAKVTADSGIDALTHAIEAYTAVSNSELVLEEGEHTLFQGANPMGARLAEYAIELVGQHLVEAVRSPNNIEAREGMALAALVAGLAFSNTGVALVHAMEYPMGGVVSCSHGAGNGILLPAVMRFNLPARLSHFKRIAELLGVPTEGLSLEMAAERSVEKVEEIRDAIGIPSRLADLGATEDQLRGFAEKTVTIRRLLRINPRAATVDELEELYRSVW